MAFQIEYGQEDLFLNDINYSNEVSGKTFMDDEGIYDDVLYSDYEI